tara:strand:+ start:354 stop:1013 length:660 start_codon:yes stop_codon:yes gene_type:complete
MTTVLIQHIGLGDHIICNAITRKFAAESERIIIPVRVENIQSVDFMFRDVLNYSSFPVDGWDSLKTEGEWFEDGGANVIWFGFNNPPFNPDIFDQEFYRQAGMDIEEKWSGWKLTRDLTREFTQTGKYIFVHDDPDREFNIDTDRVRKDLPIIRNTDRDTNNLFDLCSLIEGAEEVHCINSCVMNLIEHLKPKGDLIWHFYARPETTIMKLNQPWRRLS